MDAAPIARSYATALFELAERSGEVEAMSRTFAEVNALIGSTARLGDFLRSPKIEVEQKKRVLRTAFEGRVPPVFMNFLQVVLDKRRQRLLTEIAREYDLLLDDKLGRVNVSVTLAHEPDAAEMADITASLARLTGRDVVSHVRVDGDILGGIIVRYGDRLLDGSLRRRLISMRGRLMQATLADGNSGTHRG